MRHQLHVINGSHPCAAVMRALELKGIDVKLHEYLPPLHAPLMRMKFGTRHVPLLVLGDSGAVIPGSRRIMQRLDAIRPEPRLYPLEHTVAVEEADRWGDEVLQDVARVLFWTAIKNSPRSLASFQAGSALPSPPSFVTRLAAPAIVAGESRLNTITPQRVTWAAGVLGNLEETLERFAAAGAFGEKTPTAADLQIGSTLQLLRSVEDLRPLVDDHPLAKRVARWLPTSPGRVAAGALEPEVLRLAGLEPAAEPAPAGA